MTRFWRMRGRPTLWVPGTDHAGIATQVNLPGFLSQSRTKLKVLLWQVFSSFHEIMRLSPSVHHLLRHDLTLDLYCALHIICTKSIVSTQPTSLCGSA